ncbi:VRR-NUC domain-containing protein [Cronobacter sakazakii]|uniref:VRR-NUC domain-containing protein n=1 Tax=Cronobacter sakazakii TaxID=28141 RepID=UPI002893ABD6|nr:VRR-NUC domain-containing protein [Cronobacter sakazakii]MDT3552736.1 VRR-NUC domain-containing protein [Cronobacter sakazakii]
MAAGKRAAGVPGEPQRTATTVKAPEGTVARVTNPLDLWYLCEKVNYALKYPVKRSDGKMMYQRKVTRLIRQDDRNFNYHFPYIGEVGYDMTRNPPSPLMSRRHPNWPSSFPLAQYRLIKQGYEMRLREMAEGKVERVIELLTRDELETLPAPEAGDIMLDDALDIVLKRKGSFRIPDVIRISDVTLTGNAAFSQGNIHTVIEIKFPGDRLTLHQQRAYEDIAGDEDNFRLLETDVCQIDDKRKREWIRDAVQEPVYKPVADALGENEQICFRPDVPEYHLLEGEMEQEFRQVQHHFYQLAGDYWVPPAGMEVNTLKPQQDAGDIARQAQERERAAGFLGALLAGPMVVIPATAGVGAVAVATGESLTGMIAGTAVRYARTATTFLLPAGGLGMATAAEPEEQPSNTFTLKQAQDFVYWPD